MKDVAGCDKLRVAASERESGDLRMGKPGSGNAEPSAAEYIGCRGEPGELKHLSTPRNRKIFSISSVAASERERA